MKDLGAMSETRSSVFERKMKSKLRRPGKQSSEEKQGKGRQGGRKEEGERKGGGKREGRREGRR